MIYLLVVNPLINLLYNKGFNVIEGSATDHVFHFCWIHKVDSP